MNVGFDHAYGIKKILWTLFSFGCGVIVACLFIEIGLRLIYGQNAGTSFIDEATKLRLYRPNQTFQNEGACFENTVKINSNGFHASEFPGEKATGTYRIVVIGGSFVEALQVASDRRFTAVLEERLNASTSTRSMKFEVLPFGVSGNGTYLNILYEQAYAVSYKPDLVIMMMTEYERTRDVPGVAWPPRFSDDGRVILTSEPTSSDRTRIMLMNVVHSSSLLTQLYEAYLIGRSGWSDFAARWEPTVSRAPEALEEDWVTEVNLLTEFNRLVTEDHSRFMLMSRSASKVSREERERMQKELSAIATSSSFPYIDVTSALAEREEQEGKSAVWACDGHWNEDGHAWAGEALEKFLEPYVLTWTKTLK